MNESDWLPLDAHCRLTGELAATVRRRILKGKWVDGVHYRVDDDLTIYINPEGYNAMVEGRELAVPAERQPRKVALYRCFDSSHRLLYVGISLSILRLGQHARNSVWTFDVTQVDIEWLPDRASALEAEKAAIKREHPRHNIAHGV